MKTFNFNDVYTASINNAEFIAGTSIDEKDDNAVYFILGIFGASSSNAATIKDKDSVTRAIVSAEHSLRFPFRFDGGFEVSASSSVTVHFCRVTGV